MICICFVFLLCLKTNSTNISNVAVRVSFLLYLAKLCFYDHSSLLIDVILLLLAFLILNLQSISVYMTDVETYLSEEFYYIYKRDFEQFFTQNQFKMLFSKATKRKITSAKKLISRDYIFDKVIYISEITKPESVQIKFKEQEISHAREGTWLGITEFMTYFANNADQMKYKLDVEFVYDREHHLEIYEWNIKDLYAFMIDNEKARSSLLFCWLRYLSQAVENMDKHLASALTLFSSLSLSDNSTILSYFVNRKGADAHRSPTQKPLLR